MDLGISKINLFTNNPEKVDVFSKSEIQVIERVPIEIEAREENASYLRTKMNSMGHLIKGLNL
jgi:3,4-dihydroxy 2-butanone 4-phosphate synthase/GTP cyclohydrolase II